MAYSHGIPALQAKYLLFFLQQEYQHMYTIHIHRFNRDRCKSRVLACLKDIGLTHFQPEALSHKKFCVRRRTHG
jgi:hypothetical protein